MSRRKNLAIRVAVGTSVTAFLTYYLFNGPLWLFSVVTVTLVGVALSEFFSLVKAKGIMIVQSVGLSVGLMLPVMASTGYELTPGWELLCMMLAFLTLFVLQLRRSSSEAIVGISTALFGIVYVAWCFSFLIKIRFVEAPMLPSGAWLVAYLVAVTKSADIGAYCIGTLIGKHTVSKRISPSKTWEGVLGGMVLALLVSLAFRPVLSEVDMVHLVLLGLMLGVAGQVGDLSESLIKRDCQVKDSGQFLPGFGGILDILDSLLFTSPLCYFYVQKFLVGV